MRMRMHDLRMGMQGKERIMNKIDRWSKQLGSNDIEARDFPENSLLASIDSNGP